MKSYRNFTKKDVALKELTYTQNSYVCAYTHPGISLTHPGIRDLSLLALSLSLSRSLSRPLSLSLSSDGQL